MRIKAALLLLLVVIGFLLSGCSLDSGKWYVQAEKQLKAGNDAAARKLIDSGIKHSKDKLTTVLSASMLYSVHHQAKAQEELLSRVLEHPREMLGRDLKKAEQATLYFVLSEIHRQMGRTAKCIEALERSYQSDPDNPEIQNNLAYMYAESDMNLPQALKLAEAAHKAYPKVHYVTDTLGWVYYKLGKFDDAAELLAGVVSQSPGNADYRYHLGMAYMKAGDRIRAKIELEKAVKLDPVMTDARKHLLHPK